MTLQYAQNIIYKLVVLLFVVNAIHAQKLERPFILVKASERAEIQHKIKTQKWAKEIYSNLKAQTQPHVEAFHNNPTNYLKQLPFNWVGASKNSYPPFYQTDHIENGVHKNLDNATTAEWEPAELLKTYLQVALDCSMLYYVSQDERYAYVASSILYSFVKSVQKTKLSEWHGRGGWLFPYDGFREVRVIGDKLPLIYDFVAPYLHKGGQPFDIIEKTTTDFPIAEAQQVFKTYIDISVNYGQTNSNHPVLEAPSLVYNALAIDDPEEREHYLSYFLTENTAHQDALNVMAKNYKDRGDIWPETSQYLNHVTIILTRLMLVVNKYKPELQLGKTYENILHALPRLDYFKYPNGELVRWGDGKRFGHAPYDAYEDAYLLAKMDGLEALQTKLKPLIARAQQEKEYTRFGMEAIFWYDAPHTEKVAPLELPRTDRVYHAGIVMQRNLSTTGKAKDGLMCFVGGAHMVHGHAEGMNIELYGEGQVLGVDNGRGKYGKDLHENYSRIFAAHNTVIVNGASQGEGQWANLGINTVQVVAMEPQVSAVGVSPDHSFSQTSFEDTAGDGAEATQERTLALVRTSPTTGYYVDVFRSKSALPNEYHDFLYHNIADVLQIENVDIKLAHTPLRYKANANLEWTRGAYRNPGWHFFEAVKTSQVYDKTVKATFRTQQLATGAAAMQLHIPGFEGRTYTTVQAPRTFQAPAPYNTLPTPTLVIRHRGSAWEMPFVVVYEPFGKKEKPTIQAVSKLEQNGIYKGVKVVSKLKKKELTQYIITQSKGEEFKNDTLGLYFKGTFAIITLDKNQNLESIYIGEGKKMIYKTQTFTTNENKAFYKEFGE